LGLVDTLVIHANNNGQTSLSGVRRGFKPPQLKTKTRQLMSVFTKKLCHVLMKIEGIQALSTMDSTRVF
jgi:hypothetical protein